MKSALIWKTVIRQTTAGLQLPAVQTAITQSPIRDMKHRGFTILEILITITIMSLFMGGAFVGFSNFSKKQKLTAAGENLKNILRDVESRVTTGEMDCTVCDCSAGGVEGWFVDFTQRKYYGQCQGIDY